MPKYRLPAPGPSDNVAAGPIKRLDLANMRQAVIVTGPKRYLWFNKARLPSGNFLRKPQDSKVLETRDNAPEPSQNMTMPKSPVRRDSPAKTPYNRHGIARPPRPRRLNWSGGIGDRAKE
jgi:hypothetical protein